MPHHYLTHYLPGGPGRRLGLLLALLLLAPAAHIVGGEMDVQYLSGDTYQLTLNLYFDAINGSPAALDTELTATKFVQAVASRGRGRC